MSTTVMILAILLMAVWLCFAVISVIDAVQTLKNDRRREQLDKEHEARELEYHEQRMKALK